jgi:gluconate 5-dehydrogenase
MASVPLGLTDAYAAAKGGVALLTKSMCASVGRLGIRINAIGPGYVNTPMNAMIWANPEIKAGFERGHATGLAGARRDRRPGRLPGVGRVA